MNKSIVFHYLSKIMLVGSATFLLPCIVSLYYKEFECAISFFIVAFAVAIISLPLAIIKPKNKHMYAREGLVIVALMWVIYPIFGALPFYISGAIPNFIDAIFESISGFTTTGSTILTDIENLPNGILFWRTFTHWIGGMGVLVFAIAIFPSSNDSMYLMRAECAGPQVGKIVPKGKNSARYLYSIYLGLTILTTIFLILGDMPVFDSICHAMSTAGTGGFGLKNNSVVYYNSTYIDVVLTISMLLFGINFNMYYFLITKRLKDVFKNTELRVYLLIILISIILITIEIYPIYENVFTSLRFSSFQVVSIISSTGLATADYCQWSMLSQTILVILMFIGGCAGSTSGGLKVQRFIIMFKSAKKSIKQTLNPKSINIVTSDDKFLDISIVHGVHAYLIIYLGFFLISLLLISLNNVDFSTSFTAITTCINNIGPGLAKVGPTENFSFFSNLSKIVLSIDMLLGRLECFPIIILFSPAIWRKKF
ncbi:MAG: TrkH family potassium uptake protein [Oscillospiraceae bacterium]